LLDLETAIRAHDSRVALLKVADAAFRGGKADPKVETVAYATDTRQEKSSTTALSSVVYKCIYHPDNPHIQHNNADCFKSPANAKKSQDSGKMKGRIPVDKKPLKE
jgi:hypothetical protein